MTNARLDEISAALRKEEERLLKTRQQIQAEASACESELKQIRSALKPLTESPRSKGKRNTDSKPAPSRAIVSEALDEVRKRFDGGTIEELRQAVEKQVQENGYSRTGFSLRFKEVIAEKMKDVRAADSSTSNGPKTITQGQSEAPKC